MGKSRVGFISLGCSKNLVDTEMMIGLFKKNGFEIVNSEKDAEIIVINTCGFITPAKEEAINTIIEMSEYKKQGKCKYLIVMGCLVQRYAEDLKKTLPEVDLFLTISEYEKAWEKITKLLGEKTSCQAMEYLDRTISTGENTAYLKIAEGCSNNCTYCAIPKIRGKFVSRPYEDIVEEAEMLAKKGIKEIIVIAQDTTKYGKDLYGKYRLAELLERISQIKTVKLVRFLYAYPESITDELIETVKNNNKICNYFDIPIQHISNRILKLMNRRSNKEKIIALIEKIRKEIPNAIIRTSIIVGFPAETAEDFEELKEFIATAKLDKVGVFKYSKEDNTPAEKLPNQVHPRTKESRYNKLMAIQQEITENKMNSYIGKTFDVLVEDITPNRKHFVGRSYMDSPDVDGITYIRFDKEDLRGKIVKVKITETRGYDLIGEVVK